MNAFITNLFHNVTKAITLIFALFVFLLLRLRSFHSLSLSLPSLHPFHLTTSGLDFIWKNTIYNLQILSTISKQIILTMSQAQCLHGCVFVCVWMSLYNCRLPKRLVDTLWFSQCEHFPFVMLRFSIFTFTPFHSKRINFFCKLLRFLLSFPRHVYDDCGPTGIHSSGSSPP